MAVTLGNTDSNNGNVSSISWAWTKNAGSDLIVFVCCMPSGGNLSNVQYDGNTMTLAIRQTNTGATVTEIWYYENATTSGNITATVSSKQKLGYAGFDFGGASTPTNEIGREEDAATSSSLTVSNVISTDYLVDAITHNSATSAFTAPNQTITMDISGGGDRYLASYQVGSAGAVMDWSWSTATDAAHAAVRIPDANPPEPPAPAARRYVLIQ